MPKKSVMSPKESKANKEGADMDETETFHIDDSVFKAYDIRGIVPDQIDEAAAKQVAKAFTTEIEDNKVVVGRDVRLSGPQFERAVIDGLTSMGCDVVAIGQVSTDEFYFACATLDLPGIMITASHNPPNYNGFKMVTKMPFFVMAKEFKPKVKDIVYTEAGQIGTVSEESMTSRFIDYVLDLIPPDKIKPLKVVIDTSNGSLGPLWDKLAEQLPIELTRLCFEPDGTFPNHGNDIIQPENQQMLRDKVKEVSADIGLIFDPDGDRCLAVDDRGVSIPGDFMTALLGVEQLSRHAGATILYDVRASDAVPGHFYFKDFWYADSGVLAGLMMLSYVSRLTGPLSEKIEQLEQRYFLSGEINSTVSSPEAVMDEVKRVYNDAEIDELSGVAVRYADWHCVVRPSDNEPLVRLTLEAVSSDLMIEKRDELLALIRRF
jgi:phosphomannomutase